MGYFDIANRYAGLDTKYDPLARIDEVVPGSLASASGDCVAQAARGAALAGRKPWDAVMMFKTIVLCELYNLSDDQVGCTGRELGLSISSVPPSSTASCARWPTTACVP
jgi:hypothetical protein